jgi:hypothetical protein
MATIHPAPEGRKRVAHGASRGDAGTAIKPPLQFQPRRGDRTNRLFRPCGAETKENYNGGGGVVAGPRACARGYSISPPRGWVIAIPIIALLIGCGDRNGTVDLPKAPAPPALNTLSDEERKAGFRLLFDGKSLDGWRGFRRPDAPPVWKVIDGAMVRTASGGDIMSKDEFDAFELLTEYRIAPGGNSGIIYHVTEDDDEPGKTGPEVQILDNEKGVETEKAGFLYGLYHAEVDATKPAGQWNAVRILVTPQRSATWVNGVKYYEYVKHSDDWNRRVARSKFIGFARFGKSDRGHIDFQDHGAEVAFRNIKIREIKP